MKMSKTEQMARFCLNKLVLAGFSEGHWLAMSAIEDTSFPKYHTE